MCFGNHANKKAGDGERAVRRSRRPLVCDCPNLQSNVAVLKNQTQGTKATEKSQKDFDTFSIGLYSNRYQIDENQIQNATEIDHSCRKLANVDTLAAGRWLTARSWSHMTALRMMDGQCTVSAVGGPGEHENTQILKYKYVNTPHSRGSDSSIAPGRSGSAIGCALFCAQVWAQ